MYADVQQCIFAMQPSATGSFKSWLNNRSVSQSTCNSHDGIESVEAKEEIISSPDQVWDKTKQEDDHETYQQAVSAVSKLWNTFGAVGIFAL